MTRCPQYGASQQAVADDPASGWAALHYPWLAEPIDHPMGDFAAIRRNYLIGDFRADAARRELTRSVHVQAEVDRADPVQTLQAVADDPASGGLPSGIVAYADLAASDVDEVLEGHCAHPKATVHCPMRRFICSSAAGAIPFVDSGEWQG